MNILFYLSRFPGWGGIETVTDIIGCELIRRGYRVSVLSHASQERNLSLTHKADIFIMPEPGKSYSSRNLKYAKELVSEKNIDVIVYQDSYDRTEEIAIQMHRNGPKLIVFEHNTPLYLQKTFASFPKGSPLKQLYRHFSQARALKASANRHLKLLKESDAYVLLSAHFIPELQDVCGLERIKPYINKVRFIHNPIYFPDSETNRCKENVVLFVGRINYQKRVGVMLDIWGKISTDALDWQFEIVGDGPDREKLQRQSENANMERVVFRGYQQPREYYSKSKIFWMTSSFEGWGMTLLEAMSAGCVPIVMDTFSSVHDIIDSGINGIIVPAGDSVAFLNATKRLMEDEAARLQMSENAKKKIAQFNTGKIADDWIELLNNAI